MLCHWSIYFALVNYTNIIYVNNNITNTNTNANDTNTVLTPILIQY